MTKSKGAKLIQELINKYGDIVVAVTYDYYASRIIHDQNAPLGGRKDRDETIIKEIHLSAITGCTNWEDIKNLEAIAKGRRHKEYYPVVVEASKELYDSPEQQELRKKVDSKFIQMLNHMTGSSFADQLHKVSKI